MRDSSYYAERAQYWLFSDRIPFTKILAIANIATYLAVTFGAVVIALHAAFSTGLVVAKPWTLFTYPFVGLYCCGLNGAISLLFACYWLWVAGGSLERAWGTRTFALFFFATSALAALGVLAARFLLGVPNVLGGLWLPLAGVTIAFAMMNPEEQIMFFLIIPMKLKYLAVLDVVLVLIAFARPNPLVGVFALAGCAVSYWYVRQGRNLEFPGPEQRRQGDVVRVYDKRGLLSRLNPFRAIRDWRERKKLRDFFDKSGLGE